ncbi:SMI1/KNR4 family protein [uncultured Aquimarina sp.]|uniref:SMI1/KNR4 family protein n=1 Tax=uncultured Aquimarina sp. TaxID=575652 RepID=UPI002615BADA|nr:SMI1/KNR4 family protein [uncultured Aquimarina sp.]
MIDDLIQKFKEQDEIIYTSDPATNTRLEKISNDLNIELPEDFKNYLAKFGSLSVKSVEINGLINIPDDFDPVHQNFVGLSLESQQEYGLFKKYVQLGDAGLGDQWVLCCDPESDRFGKMFYWNPGIEEISDMEQCYSNFKEFLRDRLTRVLDD